MRAYLAVSAETPSIVEPLLAAAQRWRSAFLPDRAGPWSSRTWISPRGTAGLVLWSNENADATTGLLDSRGRALGVAGHLVDSTGYPRLLNAEDPGAVADELPGVFSVFRADELGTLAATTLARTEPVYYGAHRDFAILGNRAIAVHLVARAIAAARDDVTPSIRYNLAAMQELARMGWFLSDETPFEGVHALPAHSTIRVVGARLTIQTRAAVESDPDEPRGLERRRQLRGLADRVLNAMSPLTGMSEPIRLSLSGGRDSRLIAAALHAAGVPFTAATNGFADHPDVILPTQVSRLLGLEHRVNPPQQNQAGDVVIVKHPIDRACHAIRITEGMVSAHNNIPRPVPFQPTRTVTGVGGEQLRGGFLSNQPEIDDAAIRRETSLVRGASAESASR